LRDICSDLLNTQISVFEEEGSYDSELLSELLNQTRVNLNDIDTIFHTIKTQLKESEILPMFQKVLRCLSLIPRDESHRFKQWELLTYIIQQVVFQRNGVDPDYSLLQIDIVNFMQGNAKEIAAANNASAQKLSEDEKETAIKNLKFKLKDQEKSYQALAKTLENTIQMKSNEILELKEKLAEISTKTTQSEAKDSSAQVILNFQ
jgi:hypothetical protein